MKYPTRPDTRGDVARTSMSILKTLSDRFLNQESDPQVALVKSLNCLAFAAAFIIESQGESEKDNLTSFFSYLVSHHSANVSSSIAKLDPKLDPENNDHPKL